MFPEWTETVEDFSPQSAMYAVMRLHGLHFVEKAAVGVCATRADAIPGACTTIHRFYDVICPRLVEVSAHD
jgi:3-oxoacyl-(acyl-carrier-protein) synthase